MLAQQKLSFTRNLNKLRTQNIIFNTVKQTINDRIRRKTRGYLFYQQFQKQDVSRSDVCGHKIYIIIETLS